MRACVRGWVGGWVGGCACACACVCQNDPPFSHNSILEMLRPLGLIRNEPLESLPLNTREVPHFADYGYDHVLAIRKVCTYSQSSGRFIRLRIRLRMARFRQAKACGDSIRILIRSATY